MKRWWCNKSARLNFSDSSFPVLCTSDYVNIWGWYPNKSMAQVVLMYNEAHSATAPWDFAKPKREGNKTPRSPKGRESFLVLLKPSFLMKFDVRGPRTECKVSDFGKVPARKWLGLTPIPQTWSPSLTMWKTLPNTKRQVVSSSLTLSLFSVKNWQRRSRTPKMILEKPFSNNWA